MTAERIAAGGRFSAQCSHIDVSWPSRKAKVLWKRLTTDRSTCSVSPPSASTRANASSVLRGFASTSVPDADPGSPTKLEGPTTIAADLVCAPQSGQSAENDTLYHSFVRRDRLRVRVKPYSGTTEYRSARSLDQMSNLYSGIIYQQQMASSSGKRRGSRACRIPVGIQGIRWSRCSADTDGCDKGIAAILFVAVTAATTIAIVNAPIEGFGRKAKTAWTRFHRFARRVHHSFTDAPDRSMAHSMSCSLIRPIARARIHPFGDLRNHQ